jgi:HK97 family phage major capsid protein
MKTKKELLALITEKGDQAKAIDAGAVAAERELTEEEGAKVDALIDEVDELKAQVKAIDDGERRSARLAGVAPAVDTSAAQVAAGDDPAPDVTVGEPGWKRDPCYGFEQPRDFFMMASTYGPGQVPTKPRDLALYDRTPMATAGSDEHGGYSDPYGGFFIPEALFPGLMTMAPEGDFIGSRVRALPMTAPIVRINARTDKDHSSSVTGGLIVYRRAETDTSAATRMETEQLTFTANGLFGKAYASEELLERSPVSFAALIESAFDDEFISRKNYERFNGTGVGMFEGILNSPAIIEVAKTTNQVAATFTNVNAVAMLARSWTRDGTTADPRIWLMNKTVLPQLPLLNVTVGQGGTAVFVTDATGPIPLTLYGIPIIFTEECSALGTVGDIILWNPAEYLEGTYKPLRGLSSIHVRFENHERTFKFWMENDAKCWWRSALTPKNGDTQSPIITLATRA